MPLLADCSSIHRVHHFSIRVSKEFSLDGILPNHLTGWDFVVAKDSRDVSPRSIGAANLDAQLLMPLDEYQLEYRAPAATDPPSTLVLIMTSNGRKVVLQKYFERR